MISPRGLDWKGLVSEVTTALLRWMNVQLDYLHYLYIALIGVSMCYFVICASIEGLGKKGDSD